jgi:hypothetical protein
VPEPAERRRPCLVRVVIPHFQQMGEELQGHGSTRSDQALMRCLAVARCLGSVLALARSERDELLDIAAQTIRLTPEPSYPRIRLAGIQVECHVFVTGQAWQRELLAPFASRIRLHQVELEDPRNLPAAARSYLLEQEDSPADLFLYLEDDLVINDRLYVDKVLWYCERTQHRSVLMPHRYELTGSPDAARLFVDGPIDVDYLRGFQEPRAKVASGRFWDGQEVSFDVASNPHSGSFAISRPQWLQLRRGSKAAKEFVGPLETVATGTVLQEFAVLKPSWDCRDFLLLEHAHPSFLIQRELLPRSVADAWEQSAAEGAGGDQLHQ